MFGDEMWEWDVCEGSAWSAHTSGETSTVLMAHPIWFTFMLTLQTCKSLDTCFLTLLSKTHQSDYFYYMTCCVGNSTTHSKRHEPNAVWSYMCCVGPILTFTVVKLKGPNKW